MGQRNGGSYLRHSSSPSRIRRLDSGTEGCSQWRVLYADALGLRALRAEQPLFNWPLHDVGRFVCLRFDVQIDTGDSPVCFVAFGLLATSPCRDRRVNLEHSTFGSSSLKRSPSRDSI